MLGFLGCFTMAFFGMLAMLTVACFGMCCMCAMAFMELLRAVRPIELMTFAGNEKSWS